MFGFPKYLLFCVFVFLFFVVLRLVVEVLFPAIEEGAVWGLFAILYGLVLVLVDERKSRDFHDAKLKEIEDTRSQVSRETDALIESSKSAVEGVSNEQMFLSYFIGRKLGIDYKEISDLTYRFMDGSYYINYVYAGEYKYQVVEQISLMSYQFIAGLHDSLGMSNRLFSKYLKG
jgi:hypothetical protein